MISEDRLNHDSVNADDDTDRYTRATPPPLPVRPSTRTYKTHKSPSRRLAPPLPPKRNPSGRHAIVPVQEPVAMDPVSREKIKVLLSAIIDGVADVYLSYNREKTDQIHVAAEMKESVNPFSRIDKYLEIVRSELRKPTLSLPEVKEIRTVVRTECAFIINAVFNSPEDIENALLSLNAPEVKTINTLRKAQNCIALSYGVTITNESQQEALKLAAGLFCFIAFRKEDDGVEFWERAEQILERISKTALKASSFSRLRELLGLVMTRKWIPECFDEDGTEIPSSRIKIPSVVRFALEKLKREIVFGKSLSESSASTFSDETKKALKKHFDNVYRIMSGMFVSCHDLIAMHNSPSGLPMEVSSINQEDWQQDTFERIANEFRQIERLFVLSAK